MPAALSTAAAPATSASPRCPGSRCQRARSQRPRSQRRGASGRVRRQTAATRAPPGTRAQAVDSRGDYRAARRWRRHVRPRQAGQPAAGGGTGRRPRPHRGNTAPTQPASTQPASPQASVSASPSPSPSVSPSVVSVGPALTNAPPGVEVVLSHHSQGINDRDYAEPPDEAGKALAAGNLDVALAALDTARDLAAQGRRALKAAASGPRAPATRPARCATWSRSTCASSPARPSPRTRSARCSPARPGRSPTPWTSWSASVSRRWSPTSPAATGSPPQPRHPPRTWPAYSGTSAEAAASAA